VSGARREAGRSRARRIRAGPAGQRRLRLHRPTRRGIPDASCRGGRVSQEDTQDIEVGEPIYQCPDCGSLTIRGKWSIEGARSLTHAARMLRDYAHELEHMRASGLELASPVEADYGIVRPGGAPSDDDLDGSDDE